MWHILIEAAHLLGLYLEANEEARLHPHLWLYHDATLALYDLDVSTTAGRRKHHRRYARALSRLHRDLAAQPTGESPARSCAAYADAAYLLAEHFRRARWFDREATARGLHLRAVRVYASHDHKLMSAAQAARLDCWRRQPASLEADRAFVLDLVFLLDEWLYPNRPAIAGLLAAIDRLRARGLQHLGEIDLTQARTRALHLHPNGLAPT